MERHFDIPRIIRGDMEAFRLLFESFYVPLRNFARTYIPDGGVAEDVAQESLVKYWLRREEFDELRKIRSFLYTVTRNAMLNEMERRRMVERHAPAVADAVASQAIVDGTEDSDRMVEAEIYRMLRSKIDALPPRTREVMLLSLSGKATGQIAGTIGIARETVRALKKTAHKRLRLQLERYRRLWDDIK